MLAYCLDVTIEQFGQLLPVEPHRLLFQSHLQLHFAVRLIKYDFSLILHLALRLGAQRYGFYPQDCQKPGAFSPIIPFPSLSKSVLGLYLFLWIYKSGGVSLLFCPVAAGIIRHRLVQRIARVAIDGAVGDAAIRACLYGVCAATGARCGPGPPDVIGIAASTMGVG